jgi:sugar lactone lactonase YvrE
MLTTIRMEANRPAAALSAEAAAQPAAARVAAMDATAEEGNAAPNPYRTVENYLKLPPGRTMGSSSAVATDSKGHIWVAERCGANSCAGSAIDPIMEFDAKGNFIKALGAGMFLFPHGFYIDRNDHLWLTDGRAEPGKGAQVFEMDQNGKVLRTLGKAGVTGDGPDVFSEPNAVLVAPNGDIFVADGHNPGKGNARIVKFDKNGKFIKQWGGHGTGPGQFDVPHALAMDSKGRLFVGDRWNNRIQVFDQDGKLLAIWTQFGRPSGLYIDKNDVLYSADSESRNPQGYGYHPGWKRGIRIGSARTGQVTAFIPDTEANPDKGATSGPEGIWAGPDGAVYGAQVLQKAIVRYEKK